MPGQSTNSEELDEETRLLFRRMLDALERAGVPFLVGGAYALSRYAGIHRHTQDIDAFVRREHTEAALDALALAGFDTELSFPHWLGKACSDGVCLDIIFNSGNGLAEVDDAWFEHAVPDEVAGVPVLLCPAEEILWQKAFIMERERFDGGDVAHLLRARAEQLDWPRLLRRFGPHGRVLLSHLILFGYIYPADQQRIPAWVMDQLLAELWAEGQSPPSSEPICRGPFLSREQYLPDLAQWGYRDVRLAPHGTLADHEVAHWTDAIARK